MARSHRGLWGKPYKVSVIRPKIHLLSITTRNRMRRIQSKRFARVYIEHNTAMPKCLSTIKVQYCIRSPGCTSSGATANTSLLPATKAVCTPLIAGRSATICCSRFPVIIMRTSFFLAAGKRRNMLHRVYNKFCTNRLSIRWRKPAPVLLNPGQQLAIGPPADVSIGQHPRFCCQPTKQAASCTTTTRPRSKLCTQHPKHQPPPKSPASFHKITHIQVFTSPTR